MKYTMALDGRRLMIFNTTTNQKHASKIQGIMEGKCDEREVQGSAIPSFLEGAKFKGR
jgi:hypothetical protein